MGRWVIVGVILLAWSYVPVCGQVPSSYSDDAQRLVTMARSLWAPVELQALGYGQQHLSSAQAAARIRKACLLLQAARLLDPANTPALRDLAAVFMTDVVNDPGRAIDAIASYSQLVPSDSGPVAAGPERVRRKPVSSSEGADPACAHGAGWSQRKTFGQPGLAPADCGSIP